MKITEVTLQNFRNYKHETVKLSPFVNVFYGANAQGKTNFLESLRFMSIGKSMRTSKEKELICWDEENAKLKAEIMGEKVKKRVDISLFKTGGKRVRINNLPITKIGELMGVLTTVLFSPDEIGIIKNSPADRRRFIDIALCQLSKAYFYALNKYNKILAQRNSLLKSGKTDENSLYVWDVQLASEGARIAKSRAGFIKRLEECASENHLFLSDGKEKLTLTYEGVYDSTIELIRDKMMENLKADRDKDIKQGYTHSGIQTDDLRVEVNGIDLRKFGSQGQQRTGALSLKLAEVDIYKQESGEYPVLLLDDVFSELDKTRQNRLVEKIKGMQTVITCTHFDFSYPENIIKYFVVENGKITEKN